MLNLEVCLQNSSTLSTSSEKRTIASETPFGKLKKTTGLPVEDLTQALEDSWDHFETRLATDTEKESASKCNSTTKNTRWAGKIFRGEY